MRIATHILDRDDSSSDKEAAQSPYVNACARVLLAHRSDNLKEFAEAFRNAVLLAQSEEPADDDASDETE